MFTAAQVEEFRTQGFILGPQIYDAERAEAMRPKLRKWLASVARSLNGEDYSD